MTSLVAIDVNVFRDSAAGIVRQVITHLRRCETGYDSRRHCETGNSHLRHCGTGNDSAQAL